MISSLTWSMGRVAETHGLGSVKAPAPGAWIWVDLNGETPENIRSTCAVLGVEETLVEEAIEAGSLPLLEQRRDLIYVVLNVFVASEGGRLRSTELDLFLGPDFLISIHDEDLASSRAVQERIAQGVELPVPTPAGLLAHLAMVKSRQIPPLIDALEDQLEDLEEKAMTADPRTITQVHALRRDVIVMRRVLVPQRQIYDELAEGGSPLIDEASRHSFDRVADYQTQTIESLEAARSLLTSVLETHRGAVADQTNEIVRVLTVFSAILLPLALVTGVYGMNFINLPLAGREYGFWIILGGMAVAGVALWLYFGKRGFVGAPRLSELPKAVGLGLYHVGTAPIRVVAEGIESTMRMVGLGDEETEGKQQNPTD